MTISESSFVRKSYLLASSFIIVPLILNPYISLIPNFNSILIIELPAAPVPLTITFNSSGFLLTNFIELISAAVTTIAVPC